jgi:predicted TIM-barrel fold metal-dependent hydrolase
MRLTVALLLLAVTPLEVLSQKPMPEPIIDVHLHASSAVAAARICAPVDFFPPRDPKMPGVPPVPCAKPLLSPATDEELMTRTLDIMRVRNVIGVTSGPLNMVEAWQKAGGERILPAIAFDPATGKPSVSTLRDLVKSKRIVAFAEIGNQYEGIPPDDPRMEPYWALAEELDVPVGIHSGPGPPGAAYRGYSNYRARLSSLLLLEEVLVRHPKLRVWAMHAGWPLADDTIAALYAHPQLHVDVGVISYFVPRENFYSFLKRLLDAGFENRIMFGSDEMIFPDALAAAIDTIQNAPMLTPAQKRNILYNNAARFLRLRE